VIIGIAGAIAGRVHQVRPHPHGELIWLADVDLGDGNTPVQIVFGGDHKLSGGELVPVAPPGARVIVEYPDSSHRIKKMRTRRYRGERSHGMLCSLDELGWIRGGPNEVAVFNDNLQLGVRLDYLRVDLRPKVVEEWERAERMAEMTRRAATSPVPLWRLRLGLECY
jgi:tRNA-binding EMAP/Myf-like protein